MTARETPCQKCRAQAAELRMARENDAQIWKAAVEREHSRAERASDLSRLWKRVAKRSRRSAHNWYSMLVATWERPGKEFEQGVLDACAALSDLDFEYPLADGLGRVIEAELARRAAAAQTTPGEPP